MHFRKTCLETCNQTDSLGANGFVMTCLPDILKKLRWPDKSEAMFSGISEGPRKRYECSWRQREDIGQQKQKAPMDNTPLL